MHDQGLNGNIAVVDDDPGFKIALLQLLEAMEFACSGFDTPEALLASGRLGTFDCLVSDVQMPRLDGFGLIKALRHRQWTKPVLLVTARSEDDLHRKAQASGALVLLPKPLQAATLLEWLQKAVMDGTCYDTHDRWHERHDRSDR